MRAQRHTATDEGGFTLTEVLIASAIVLMTAMGVLALMLTSFRQTDNQFDRIVVLDETRNGLLKMIQEIRGAAALSSVSPQVLDVLVHFPDDEANPFHWIRYKCVGNDQGSSEGLGGTCSRQDKTLNSGSCDKDGNGPGCTVIIRRVVKHGEDHFAEPCDNYEPGSQEEKHFCVKQNRTVQLSIFADVPGATNPLELRSAATVRNCIEKGQVIPCIPSTPSS